MEKQTITQLINQGNFQSAIRELEQALQTNPNDANILNWLGLCYFNCRDKQKGLQLMEKSIELEDNNADYLFNFGSALRINEQFQKAEKYLNKVIQLQPENPLFLGTTAHLNAQLDDFEQAKKLGAKCLTIKSNEGIESFQRDRGKVFELHLSKEKKGYQKSDINIIAFSLWGDNPFYTQGAIINAMIAPYIYPEWQTRFYVDKSVPLNVIERLQALGAQVAVFENPQPGYKKLLWRFLASDDKNVTRFICRDCDSRLNVREKNAVDEWVNSGKAFHLMRDSYAHCELILAGMWGGISGVLPDMVSLIESYEHKHAEKWIDQHFLKNRIWPLIKDEVLAHDDCYQFHHAQPFPSLASYEPGVARDKVGSSIMWDLQRLEDNKNQE